MILRTLVLKMSSAIAESSAPTMKQIKSKLRKAMDAKLSQLSEAELESQSSKVASILYGLEEFQKANRVGLYLSLPGEIATIPILEECFKQSKQCFVPCYTPKSPLMTFVEIRSMKDYESMPIEPKWQIKQPDPKDTSRANALDTGGLDLLLVPGVAFTKSGDRLGHGMGYFDRWQAKCFNTSGIRHPYTIALSLNEQVIDEVPITDTDVRINKIVYPNMLNP